MFFPSRCTRPNHWSDMLINGNCAHCEDRFDSPMSHPNNTAFYEEQKQWLEEHGLSHKDLQKDKEALQYVFKDGKRIYLPDHLQWGYSAPKPNSI